MRLAAELGAAPVETLEDPLLFDWRDAFAMVLDPEEEGGVERGA